MAKPQLLQNLNWGGEELPIEQEVASHPSKIYFDQQMDLLKFRLAQTHDPGTRVQIVKQSIKDIREYRKRFNMAEMSDEIHMEIVLQSLESLPGPKKFEQKRCPAYENKILVNFQSTAVEQSLGILNSICR